MKGACVHDNWNYNQIKIPMKTLFTSLAVILVLAINTANAGSLAPAPRVIATYDRDFLESSGSQTLEELLHTGIIRYLLTGGHSLLVLVDGRPYAITSSHLDALPISSIERIELLSGDTLGTLDGDAVRGAMNIVLRNDLDGFEVRTVTRMPDQKGGDGRQGSFFWGGAVGEGRMTLGVDVLDREEITGQSRDYSRSVWSDGGAFNQARNVSVGGNTVWIVQRDEDQSPTGVRSIALGKCDPEKGYTGPLSNPPGIASGDKGCGYAYGRIIWNSSNYEQQSVVLDLDHPLPEGANFHLDANITQNQSAFRYAPSVGYLPFVPNEDLLAAVNDAADPDFEADDNDLFVVAHRFVHHGNRDWLTDTEELHFSMNIENQIKENLGYDLYITAFDRDGFQSGDTFVHADRIASEIQAGHYDLANPFSDAPEHLRAIKDSSLRLENDFGSDYLGVRLALEGTGFRIGDHDSTWTTGTELGKLKIHDISVYRSNDDMAYDVSEVLGSSGASYAGSRKFVAAFGEISMPLAENLDFRVAGRADDYDDTGGLGAWRLGTEYRPSDVITLHSSLSTGDRPPSMLYLHSSGLQDHPFVECDPGTGSPPRSCTQSNPQQVTRVTEGNPNLDPSDNERLAIGVGASKGALSLDMEWYQLSRSGLPGQNSANWALQNLNECADGDRMNCIERIANDITIYNSYANVTETDLSGVDTRINWSTATGWGIIGLRGVWQRVTDAKLRIAGEKSHYPIPEDVIHLGILAKRGDLSATWGSNYRSSYENRAGTGIFKSWTGHNLALAWSDPPGMKGARIAAGVFNITDAGLSVDTANPSRLDGPTEAGWGRTWFLTFNMRF